MKMKQLSAMTLLTLSACSVGGQASASQTNDVTATVTGCLLEMRTGLYTSIAAKALGRLGDEAAKNIISNYTLKEMSTQPMSTAIAEAIAASFDAPSLIVVKADETPKISLLLLTYLKSTVKSPEELHAVDLASEVVNRQLQAQAAQDKQR